MPKHVTETTQLQCDKGTTPTPLAVTSQSFMKIEGKLQATEEDKKPNVNIKPFGVCSITRMSCNPAPIKWQNTSVFEIDGKKELLDTSTCQCSVGGKISIVKSAQNFVEEGGKSIYQPIVYERNEKEEEKIIDEVIKDIYINKIDASVFINYGKKDGDIRMITKGEWSSGNEMPDGEKNKYLIENSKIVTVNDAQIQEKLQEIHRLTNKTEQQIYIYLDRDSASIKAVLGAEGTDGEATISSEQDRLGKDENGNIIYSKEIIRSGDVRGALLGQAHTHNLMYNNENNNKTSASSTIGGEKTVNDFGTSEKDKGTSKSLNINIYALDCWNFSSKNAEVTIGRVTPAGIQKSSIGKTYGKGDGKKTVNIGLECLNLRIGR